jgi:hypothetical protein
MSTTIKASKAARRAGRDAAQWRPAREPGKTLITIQPDDPFQSLLMPSFEPGPLPTRKNCAFAGAPIQQNTRPQVFAEQETPAFVQRALEPQAVLEREYVPREDYRKAKASARDAWTAVTLMGMFLAGGVYYAVDRVGNQGDQINALTAKVDDLNQQLTNERGVVMTRNTQIAQLNEELREAKKAR